MFGFICGGNEVKRNIFMKSLLLILIASLLPYVILAQEDRLKVKIFMQVAALEQIQILLTALISGVHSPSRMQTTVVI